MDWDDDLVGGSFFTGVVRIVDCDGAFSCQGRTLQKGEVVRLYLQKAVDWQSAEKLTVLHFLVQVDAEGCKLIQTGPGRFFIHPPFDPSALLVVKEACCGIGALGRGLAFLGYEVVVQNDVQAATLQEAVRLSGATAVLGDISRVQTVIDMWDAKPGDGTLAAGVACQPYSRLGDRRSFRDERSSTLPGTLRASYLMQQSCTILECVPQVLQDSWVQQLIREYSAVTGHISHQTVLSLHQVWSAKRERWWCVVARPGVAPPGLTSWKPHGPWHTVADVMDCFNASRDEELALSLSAYEKETFESLRPISSYCIQVNQPLPTALHSWGSPLTACPCGCRSAPFRWERLQESGICSVLVPFKQEDGGRHFRFPSAAEVALLCGLTPCLAYGDPRLSLTLIGQLASPLQAAWIGVQIASRLRDLGVRFSSSLDGVQVLHTQRRLLLRDAETMGFRPSTVPGSLSHCPSLVFETHAQIVKRHCQRQKNVSHSTGTLSLPNSGLDLAPVCLPAARSVGTPRFGLVPDPPRIAAALPRDPGAGVALSEIRAPKAAQTSPHHPPGFPSGFDPVPFGFPPGCPPFPPSGLDLNLCPLTAAVAACAEDVAEANVQHSAKRARLSASDTQIPGVLPPAPEGPSARGIFLSHRQVPTPGDHLGQVGSFAGVEERTQPIALPGGDAVVEAMPAPIPDCVPGWHHFVARKSVPVLQVLLEDFASVPGFLLVDEQGSVVPPSASVHVGKGYRIWVPNGCDGPAALLPPIGTLAKCWPGSSTCMPASIRKVRLPLQGTCLADDQVSYSLAFIAGCAQGIKVLEPLLLLQCLADGRADPLREFVPAMTRGCHVISCIPLKGHWVACAWSILGGKVRAWVSMPGNFLAEDISRLQWLWGKATGLSCGAFDFVEGVPRPPVPGLCGHYAIADLCCFVLGQQFQTDLSALGIASTIAASFEFSLTEDHLVRAPLFIASGAGDLIEQGLVSLLKDRGVPADRAPSRAAQAVQRLGLGPIQTAMSSPNAWRCLKQLGNNATPAFQFVLQDELAQVVLARAAVDPSSKRQKKRTPGVARDPVTSLQVPIAPQVDQVRIPVGVFASEGKPLHQVELQSIDAQTQGIVLVSPEQAAPYLNLLARSALERLLWSSWVSLTCQRPQCRLNPCASGLNSLLLLNPSFSRGFWLR